MSRKLYLLRHGKAEGRAGVQDRDRPLKERGKRGAEQIGLWMLQQDRVPEHILSSPAMRALSTAHLACQAMGQPADRIRTDDRIYGAGTARLLKVLADVPRTYGSLLLVGHNPGLEGLLLYLAGDKLEIPARGKLLPTAALAGLTLPGSWRRLDEGCATPDDLVLPRDLPRDFPYPGNDGEERRDRPAYYYTQSSVIPYRIAGGAVEILILTSSSGKSWILPKGIVDPGLTPRESARKEALEEAGVIGEPEMDAIGSYDYGKWGGTCHVQVFPMEVTRELDDSEWEESHRTRVWLSPESAAEKLTQPRTRELVLALARTKAPR